MAYRNLDEFLIRLEQADDLIHHTSHPITESVIYERSVDSATQPEQDNHVLWFEGMNNSPFPVVTNIFSTERRMAWGFRLDNLTQLEQRLAKLLDPSIPNGFGGLMQRAGDFFSVFRSISAERKRISSAQSQQVIISDAADLTILPALRTPHDAECATITFTQMITHIDDQQNMCLTDVKIRDARTLLIPKQALTMTETNTNIPTAIIIGGDPATMWCGLAPLPDKIDPYLLAGWIRGKPVRFTEGISQPINVPADAEIIIEGEIDLLSKDSNHDNDYIMTVTAITHRNDAVFPVITAHDRRWLHKAVERLFMPVMRLILPEVHDMNLPFEYGLHNLALISINKHYAGQAHKVMHGLWGMGQLALLKTIIVVDADVDVQQSESVLTHILDNVDPAGDIMHVHGLRQDHLTGHRIGDKIGIDATRKPDTIHRDMQLDDDKLSANIIGKYRVYGRFVLVAKHSETCDVGKIMSTIHGVQPHAFVIVVDYGTPLDDSHAIATNILTNVEWTRDITTHITHGLIGIDATHSKIQQEDRTESYVSKT